MVLGTSPRLPFDALYQDFLRVIAHHVGMAIGEAEARRGERERAERLAELDRAKVEFFSNVSHEFRTPLTLLLGPLEELLARRHALPTDLGATIAAAARNGRRLLTLVNTLLDFSQAESHRQQACFEPTDLAALTRDITSAFRSAFEAAGLKFEVQCGANMPEVWIDRQMWEKIVSNLLSNALKFTFEGQVTVSLEPLKLHVQLVVSDTGVGIPEHELSHLFKRFHRVRGARARTSEGSGIGLWMVNDLVKRIGGQIVVRSKENVGTSFRVWVAYKTARVRQEDSKAALAFRPTEFASLAAEEASRWLSDTMVLDGADGEVLEGVFGPPPEHTAEREAPRACVLVVDDNADMRAYLERLLSPRWRVISAADGARAFDAALDSSPDVILADVMMPGLDGFGLLERLRADPVLRHTPVLLLTARSGENAAIDGLLAGADDYIPKPFSPRELVARIAGAVERAGADAALRKSEEKYRTLFHSIDEGFCVIEVLLDRDGRAFDYRFIEMNPVFAAHTGLHETTGRTMRELAPEHEEFWYETYGEIARTGQARRFEHCASALGRWYDVYACRIGAPEERKVAIVLNDISEKKRTDEILRESAVRKAFQLELSDALRPLSETADILNTATRILGVHLDVDRATYLELADDAAAATARADYTRSLVSGWTGAFSLAAFGEAANRVRRGETVVIRDETTRSSEAEGATHAERQAGASICVPLIKADRLSAVLVVQSSTPREWTDGEIALVQETVERTWAAVERGRASELQARNRELERFHHLTVGRELRMVELKKQVNSLRARLGEPPRYALEFEKGEDDEGA
jgi:CheY-like chemotaxis protein/GAF domain-containing protein